jgi:hypothetical protein
MAAEHGSFRPLSWWSQAAIYSRRIVTNVGHKLVLNRRRHRDQVAADYEQGAWAGELRQQYWLKAPTLHDYLIPETQGEVIVLHDGRLARTSPADYYQFRLQKVIELISENDGGATELVELGSGTGRNIFSLSTARRWKRLWGYDISDNGIKVAQSVKERYRVEEAEFGKLDLIADDFGTLECLRDATVFTYLCLEQLPGHAEQILRKLLKAGVRRGIHIEPSLDLFRPWRLRDLSTISYVWRQNYQRKLISALRTLETEGRIKIERMERPGFAPSPAHEPNLVVWTALPQAS